MIFLRLSSITIAASVIAETRLRGSSSSFWVVEDLSISSFLATEGFVGGARFDYAAGMPTSGFLGTEDFVGGAIFDFAAGMPTSGFLATEDFAGWDIFDFAVGLSISFEIRGGARLYMAVGSLKLAPPPCDMGEY